MLTPVANPLSPEFQVKSSIYSSLGLHRLLQVHKLASNEDFLEAVAAKEGVSPVHVQRCLNEHSKLLSPSGGVDGFNFFSVLPWDAAYTQERLNRYGRNFSELSKPVQGRCELAQVGLNCTSDPFWMLASSLQVGLPGFIPGKALPLADVSAHCLQIFGTVERMVGIEQARNKAVSEVVAAFSSAIEFLYPEIETNFGVIFEAKAHIRALRILDFATPFIASRFFNP